MTSAVAKRIDASTKWRKIRNRIASTTAVANLAVCDLTKKLNPTKTPAPTIRVVLISSIFDKMNRPNNVPQLYCASRKGYGWQNESK
jgi:hypothetical protein